jgi:hypothetical protein
MLYKYRGLSNLLFALDIFTKQRLFAASFVSLNDPMEGHYVYEAGALTQSQIRKIYGQKMELGILSLSKTPSNMLMWSYYAEANTGMAVGVEITDENAQTVSIDYVDELALEQSHPDVPMRILSKKLKPWSHEQEHRVFTRGSKYVDVRVKEVVFGLATNELAKELVTEVAKKFCPRVKIRTIRARDLERGILARVDA